jgi:L-seryl-tRNA(Ser) seleniumtransferase
MILPINLTSEYAHPMTHSPNTFFSKLPSVDSILTDPTIKIVTEEYGHTAITKSVRVALQAARNNHDTFSPSISRQELAQLIVNATVLDLEKINRYSLTPVFNLSGTVLHTNLGRASLPDEAVEAMIAAARSPTNLEYDLATGKRGSRDSHVEALLCELTGAEAATVVNNNAAAVLVALNSLALRKEVIVSRGELIEIGGAFRIPEIMTRAGAKLREVGTTNRTHRRDYEDAISPRTGLLMKVHTSNYRVEGFTAAVDEKALAVLGREHGVPLMIDLGSGTLTELTDYGLPHEPMAGESIASGANLVTFSGDKLLGGPQAGLIVGDRALIEKIKRNPMTRALRVDKIRLAALEAVLRLYLMPDKLGQRLPVLRTLTRPIADILQTAETIAAGLREYLPKDLDITIVEGVSAIGSGSLPGEELITKIVMICPTGNKKDNAKRVRLLDKGFRSLATPVIGRVSNGNLMLDMRCLDNTDDFIKQLDQLSHLIDSNTRQ